MVAYQDADSVLCNKANLSNIVITFFLAYGMWLNK